MNRTDFLGIAVNIAAVVIVIGSVVLAIVMYREPQAVSAPVATPDPIPTLPAITQQFVTSAASTLPVIGTPTPAASATGPKLTRTMPFALTPSLTPTITPTRPLYCAKLPWLTPTAASNAAGSPFPAGAGNGQGSPSPAVKGSPTPLPIAHTYDLDPALPLAEKSHLIIFRCSGTWDAYWLGSVSEFPSRVLMNAGDVIYDWVQAAALTGTGTVTATTTRTATPTP